MTLRTNFKQNRPTFISKSAPVSQAEALKYEPKARRAEQLFYGAVKLLFSLHTAPAPGLFLRSQRK